MTDIAVAGVIAHQLEDPRAYMRVAALLRGRITEGDLALGDRIPSIGALRHETGRSRHTVGKALRLLEQEGLVARVAGLGYYVVGTDAHGRR